MRKDLLSNLRGEPGLKPLDSDLRHLLGSSFNRGFLELRTLGIVLSTHTADDGATIYRQACAMGLEGIVSKRLTAPYRSGPSRDWLKIKNPNSPAMARRLRSD
jgi:ATP-dependent DNA ligase